MRKVVSILAAVLIISLLLVGCNKPAATEPAPAAEPAPSYPERNIEFVIPFGAGGGSDLMARTVVMAVEKDFPVVITPVNKEGGSGAVGYTYLAGKKDDSYFIATTSSSFFTTPLVGGSPVTYKDFTPVCSIADDVMVMFAKGDSVYESVEDVVAALKAKPESVSMAGTSVASTDRIITALLEDAAGVKFKYIGFDSGSSAATQVLGGHVDLGVGNPGEILSHLQAGTMKALGVASDNRLENLPDAKTFKEQGYDVSFTLPRGLVGPAGMTDEAVAYWNKAIEKMTKESEVWKKYMTDNMLMSNYLPADKWAQRQEQLNARYTEVFKNLGIIK